MNKILIYLGDPSQDGHGKSDFFVFNSNKTLEEIISGYENSCKLVGVCFDEDTQFTRIRIATEYEDNTISKEAEKNLLKNGIDVWDGFDLKYFDKENDLIYIDGTEHFMDIFEKFLKISLPDLILEEAYFKKSEMGIIPRFPFSMGYGLFY